MDTVTVIAVEGENDIILARSAVRVLARFLSLSPTDQARISLATSSLAHFLDMGGKYTGEIRMEPFTGGGPAIQVSFLLHCGDAQQRPDYRTLREFERVRQMVDDLELEILPSEDVRVLLVKRASSS